MICSYCHQTRNDTPAPCPYCGTPSPLGEQAQAGSWGQINQGSWEQSGQVMPAGQVSFDASPFTYATQNWATPETAQQQPNWNMSPQVEQASPYPGTPPQNPQSWNPAQSAPQSWGMPQQKQQSWTWNVTPENQPQQQPNMPQQQQPGWNTGQPVQPTQFSPTAQAGGQKGLVPYQGGIELQAASSRTSMLQILPADVAERMLPTLPQEDMAVYVPPMYTKPRAIIPRYRAISGLLSIIIVGLMLCTGAGYAAKANGTLDTLTRIVTGDSHPAPLPKAATNDLPEPKTLIDRGPAYGIIYSATTTSRVDATTGLPIQEEHIFTANEKIHLTYAVQSAKPGTVDIQWFSNGNPLMDPIKPAFDPKDGQNKHADATIVYQLPAEGWVELKWNNQLAMRLYFVVRPAA